MRLRNAYPIQPPPQSRLGVFPIPQKAPWCSVAVSPAPRSLPDNQGVISVAGQTSCTRKHTARVPLCLPPFAQHDVSDACSCVCKQSSLVYWWLVFVLCIYHTCLWMDSHLLLGIWVVFRFGLLWMKLPGTLAYTALHFHLFWVEFPGVTEQAHV